VINQSYREIGGSTLFRLRDQLAGHLNDATATQAIERDVGVGPIDDDHIAGMDKPFAEYAKGNEKLIREALKQHAVAIEQAKQK